MNKKVSFYNIASEVQSIKVEIFECLRQTSLLSFWPFLVWKLKCDLLLWFSNTVNLRQEMKQFLSLRSWEWSAEECLFFVWPLAKLKIKIVFSFLERIFPPFFLSPRFNDALSWLLGKRFQVVVNHLSSEDVYEFPAKFQLPS